MGAFPHPPEILRFAMTETTKPDTTPDLNTSASRSPLGPSLEHLKLQSEIEKLELEKKKLRADLVDLKRPYIMRNSQLLTAVIATVGAVIGLGIALEKDYFKMLLDEAHFEQEKADDEENKATADESEAAGKMQLAQQNSVKAEQLRQTAERREQEAAARIKNADREIWEAEKRAAEAVANRDKLLLRGWSIPDFVYDQQAQLTTLFLFPKEQAVPSLSWLTAPLTQLRVGIANSTEKVLSEIPQTVSVLDITVNSDVGSVDLSNLRSPGTVTDLTVRVNDVALGYPYKVSVLTISGLKQLRNLRFLTVLAHPDIPLKGLEDALDLPKLQRATLAVYGLSDVLRKRFQQPPEPSTGIGVRAETGCESQAAGRYVSRAPARVMPEVRTVRIEGCPRGMVAALARFPNLDELSIHILRPDSLDQRSNEELVDILSWIAQRVNLRALDLYFAKDSLDGLNASQRALDVSRLTRLEHFSVDTADHDIQVTGIASLKALKELRVNLNAIPATDLSVLPKLEQFVVLSPTPFPQEREKQSALVASVARIRSLRSLCVQASWMWDPAFETILRSAHLEHLTVLSQAPPIDKLPGSVRELEFSPACPTWDWLNSAVPLVTDEE